LVTGAGGEWLTILTSRGLEDTRAVFNISPVAHLGPAWLVLSVPLALLLTWRGWVGLAGVVASPYLLAQYLLMLFADVRIRDNARLSTRRDPGQVSSAP
jgi:hypothetical protein